jgi:hypothetical protein
MKVSDLRIGNLILDTNYTEERLFKVKEVNISILEDLNNPDFEFKPIPLTEEWLVKFGFKNCTLKKFRLTIGHWEKRKCSLYWRKGKGFCKSGKGIKVKYVHQLQNLYFALTNTELTINA